MAAVIPAVESKLSTEQKTEFETIATDSLEAKLTSEQTTKLEAIVNHWVKEYSNQNWGFLSFNFRGYSPELILLCNYIFNPTYEHLGYAARIKAAICNNPTITTAILTNADGPGSDLTFFWLLNFIPELPNIQNIQFGGRNHELVKELPQMKLFMSAIRKAAHLKRLEFSHDTISDLNVDSLDHLIKSLAECPHITQLQLPFPSFAMKDEHLKLYEDMIKNNPYITHLYFFQGNDVNFAGFNDIMGAIAANPRLTTLNFFGCHLANLSTSAFEKFTKTIAEHSGLTNVEYVMLRGISDMHFQRFWNAIKTNKNIKKLSVGLGGYSNDFEERELFTESLPLFAQVMCEHPSIEYLGLYGSPILFEGSIIHHFLKIVTENTRLRALNLSSNRIDDNFKKLIEGIKINSRLTELRLEGEELHDKDFFEVFLDLIRTHESLTSIDLRSRSALNEIVRNTNFFSQIDLKQRESLLEAIKENKMLLDFWAGEDVRDNQEGLTEYTKRMQAVLAANKAYQKLCLQEVIQVLEPVSVPVPGVVNLILSFSPYSSLLGIKEREEARMRVLNTRSLP